MTNKNLRHQMSVRPKELLNSWTFLWSAVISHSRRKNKSGLDCTTSL